MGPPLELARGLPRAAAEQLESVFGMPCWNVKRGVGSFLTFEFGAPHLVVREPREHAGRPPRRLVHVHGEAHLWITCCRWHVESRGAPAGDSSSKRGVDRAADVLGGQKLTRVTFDPRRVLSTFDFDLGGRLEAYPYPRRSRHYDPTDTMWMLRVPSGHWLSLRADGRYSYVPGSSPPDQEGWVRLAEPE